MTNAQAIAVIVILIVIAVICVTIWGIVSKTDENVRLYIDELNAKLGKYDHRITVLERKARTKSDTSKMTDDKMNAISEWLGTVDMNALTVADKLEIEHAAVEHLASLEALYDKYHESGKDVRYR